MESSISACVNDPENGSCNTFIQLEKQAGVFCVDGECSCDQEFNCVHVVATLISMIDSASVSQTVHQTEQPVISSFQAVQFNHPDKSVDKQLHFILSPSANWLQLQLFALSDEWVSVYVMPHSLTHPARFISSADVLLLRQIQQHTRLRDGLSFALSHAKYVLISQLIGTARCHWLAINNPALQLGRMRVGEWVWHQHIDGSQQLILKPQDDVTLLPTQPSMYIDKQKHCLGLLDSGLAKEQDQQLFSLPAFQPEDIESALKRSELKKLEDKLTSPHLKRRKMSSLNDMLRQSTSN